MALAGAAWRRLTAGFVIVAPSGVAPSGVALFGVALFGAALFGTGVFGNGLRAQDISIVHLEGERHVFSVKMTPFAGAARPGGLGFVLVDAQNLDGRPHALAIEIASREWADSNVATHRSLLLGPNERGRFYLPMPSVPRYESAVAVTIDGTLYKDSLNASNDRGPATLLLSDYPSMTASVLGMVQALWPSTSKRKRDNASVASCVCLDAPNDWRLFTAFDMIVVDGRSRVPQQLQETLRRVAHAGGRLLVLEPDRMPPGVLRDALEGLDGTQTVRYGLGAMTASPTLSLDTSRLRYQLSAKAGNTPLWPMSDELQGEQEIPGLDRAPVLAFLLVILLFAVIVGPVNFFLLRRARRPMLALVTVPAIGFGTTLLMFGYAIVHDGFGVRGVVRSWSLLDQTNHEVATIASRTLFAGLAPAGFVLGDDSLLLAPAAFDTPDSRSRHRWSYDGQTGELGGGVLPARTPTVLVTARQGIARERLRAEVAANGSLELLLDGGVVPQGEVVVCDREGRYWAGTSPRLPRCTPAEAEQKVQRFVRSARVHHILDRRGDPKVVTLDSLAAALLPDGQLPPGSYIARVERAPWLPEHDLTVDYEVQEHFVVGRFGAEDIVQ